MSFRAVRTALALCLLVLAASEVRAQTGANVLVVANEAVPGSLQIAERYVARRNVPAEQLLRVRTMTTDEIARPDFERTIQAPIAAWIGKHQAQDRILYIVLTKGIPLRISGTAGRSGTIASVDSELTLLYRRMTGMLAGPNGSIENPYFLAKGEPAAAARFTHAKADIYLVTRLDGFTVEDALALIDRAATPASAGKILLDQRTSLNDVGNGWLSGAATALAAAGFGDRVTLDTSSRIIDGQTQVLGYYSWGSNDPAQRARRPDLQFVPGAIAGMFLSSDARTFVEPPAAWKPGGPVATQQFFAGTTQSLTGDLIRGGVTGVAGQVAEPYLDSAVRPDILFPAYLAGFNLAEAFYLALPALSWQTVVIGDPLCAPFARDAAAKADTDPPIDPQTELPSVFSARRADNIEMKTASRAALLKILLAQSRQSRDDLQGAREAFEEALTLDPKAAEASRVLASIYEQLDDHDKADAIYRTLLKADPNDITALNNLAYSLAVRHNNPKEALPLAERADLLSPRSALIYDTLGWIKHLLGEHAEAARMLVLAATSMPTNMDVQLHAAAALADADRVDDAAKILKAAEAVDPKILERPEYAALQAKIRR